MVNFHLLIPSSPFLIPNATNAKALVLIGPVVAGYIGIAVGQSAVPSVGRNALCTTPPETDAANEAVCTIDVAVTAREGCES